MSEGRKLERPILVVCILPLNFAGAEIAVKGMDELQLEEVCAAICGGKKEYVQGAPKVILLETVRKPAEGEGKYIRQTGGVGNYGHVRLRLEPKGEGEGFEFLNQTPETMLPSEFVAAAEAGVLAAVQGGVLFGYEITDVMATLIDGSYHATDSNPMAFQIAGSMAFKDAARKASPVLLEPVMSVNAVVPESDVGMICLDINMRHGRIESIEPGQNSVSIDAKIPLRETLRSSRHGSFHHPMRCARYEQVAHPHGEFGGDALGVGVPNPRRPNLNSGRAEAELYFELE